MTYPKIVWTAKETMACALCWAGFDKPWHRTDTPEQYWVSITEQSRNHFRTEAKRRLLLAVARGGAVPVMQHTNLREGQFEAIGAAIGLTKRHRIIQIIHGIRRALDPKNAIVGEFE